jgi:hypothetical protein
LNPRTLGPVKARQPLHRRRRLMFSYYATFDDLMRKSWIHVTVLHKT